MAGYWKNANATAEVLRAQEADSGISATELRVDGGACRNDFLMQFQSDILGTTVDRPKVVETTATGAAFLAGLGVSFWTQAELERVRAVDKVFKPKMTPAERSEFFALVAAEKKEPVFKDPLFERQTAFLEDPARMKVVLCTRRSGKSYGAGLLLFRNNARLRAAEAATALAMRSQAAWAEDGRFD